MRGPILLEFNRPTLTPREVQVLQWILDGKSDGDIAAILGISAKTINFHVENAKRKLGAFNRVRAIAVALTAGSLRLTNGDLPEDDDSRRARPRAAAGVSRAHLAPAGLSHLGVC